MGCDGDRMIARVTPWRITVFTSSAHEVNTNTILFVVLKGTQPLGETFAFESSWFVPRLEQREIAGSQGDIWHTAMAVSEDCD